MAYIFRKNWAEEVAEVSTQPEFQTCEVRIDDPSRVTRTYNEETGKYETVGNSVIYEDRARVIGVNQAGFDSNEAQANPTNIIAVRVQLAPGHEDVRVKTGCTLTVIEAPRNPVLTTYVYKAASDFQGSSAGARTLLFRVDMDSARA